MLEGANESNPAIAFALSSPCYAGIAKDPDQKIILKWNSYTGWISYTFTDAENTYPLLNDGVSFPAPQIQRNEIKIFNNYETNGWNFSASFIYGSGQTFTEPSYKYNISLLDESSLTFIGVGPKNGSLLPDYHRLDVSVHHVFNINKSKGDIGLSINKSKDKETITNENNNESSKIISESDLDTFPFKSSKINSL